jgi:uncharacterized protein involved in type VI secretion and phage assembly
MTRFYGKYRGTVSDNLDPEKRGRIKANVPAILGSVVSGWALPAFPFAGKGKGFFGVPETGSLVWIEFEAGDLEYPIWTGGFYGSMADVPPETLIVPDPSQVTVIATSGGGKIILNDTPGPLGGITLEIAGGAKITINDLAITIDNGMGAKVEMTGPQVSVNGGALEVI